MNLDERGQALAIGQRIRARRFELGLSQRQLSQPGVSYAYISRLEAGTRTPSVKALRLLAPRLNVSVEWLETGQEASRFAKFDDDELRLSSGRSDRASPRTQSNCLPSYDSSDPGAARVKPWVCLTQSSGPGSASVSSPVGRADSSHGSAPGPGHSRPEPSLRTPHVFAALQLLLGEHGAPDP